MTEKKKRSARVAHERVQVDPGGESLTKQSFQKESNINSIMKRYEKDGILDHVNQFEGNYGDFTSAPDYHRAMSEVTEAQQMFDTLPSKIRKKFDNNPAEFLEFVQNPENEAEMREMGLLPTATQAPVEPEAEPEGDTPSPPVKPSEGTPEASEG